VMAETANFIADLWSTPLAEAPMLHAHPIAAICASVVKIIRVYKEAFMQRHNVSEQEFKDTFDVYVVVDAQYSRVLRLAHDMTELDMFLVDSQSQNTQQFIESIRGAAVEAVAEAAYQGSRLAVTTMVTFRREHDGSFAFVLFDKSAAQVVMNSFQCSRDDAVVQILDADEAISDLRHSLMAFFPPP
jgi:hypothetical protein